MPVPTPPKKDLFKVRLPSTEKRVMRPDSKKLDDDIKEMIDYVATALDIPVEVLAEVEKAPDITVVKMPIKRAAFASSERLMQSPFRDNEDMRKLQRELNKETDPKKPVKRSPRRKPATLKTTGEK